MQIGSIVEKVALFEIAAIGQFKFTKPTRPHMEPCLGYEQIEIFGIAIWHFCACCLDIYLSVHERICLWIYLFWIYWGMNLAFSVVVMVNQNSKNVTKRTGKKVEIFLLIIIKQLN